MTDALLTLCSPGALVFVAGSLADVLSSRGIGRGRLSTVREKNPLWARRDGTFRAGSNAAASVAVLGVAFAAVAWGAPAGGVEIGLLAGGLARAVVAGMNVRLRRRARRWPG